MRLVLILVFTISVFLDSFLSRMKALLTLIILILNTRGNLILRVHDDSRHTKNQNVLENNMLNSIQIQRTTYLKL